MILEAFFGLGLILVWWFINDQFISGKDLPPGPFRVPIIGTWSTFVKALTKNREVPYITFEKLSKKYGPIITLRTGALQQIVVDDPEIMKEALARDDLANRGKNDFVLERSWGQPMGILFGTGESWKELRRFSIRNLRDFGFGKQASQEVLMEEELKELMETLNEAVKSGNNIVPMTQFFTVSILNILWSMVAGTRFSHKDPKLESLVNTIAEWASSVTPGGNFLMAFPFFRHIFALFPGSAQKGKQNLIKLHAKFEEILIERRQLGLYKEDQRDFIDVFLKEIDKQNEHGYSSTFNDKQFIVTLLDLFSAGSETTANTCEFAILYMMLNPEVQKKVQAEIDRVIGRNRFPTNADRVSMPYTEATIHEIQRLSNIAPLFGRSPAEDATLRGYKIPKNTLLIMNGHSAHTNPTIWNDPDTFKPERFLDAKNKIINADKLLAFGSGKRVCLGEVMARTTLFTYFTTLLQNYTFEVSPSHPRPSTTPRFGITQVPQLYSTLVKARV